MIVMDKENQAISTLKDQHIAFQDKIIDKYSKLDKNNQTVDTNSQRIDTLGMQNVQLFRDQHAEDKQAIASLQQDLNSCRSSQKWVFGAGAITGGFVGYKLRGVTQSIGTSSGTSNFTFASQTPAFNFGQTQTEQKLREVLKKLNH